MLLAEFEPEEFESLLVSCFFAKNANTKASLQIKLAFVFVAIFATSLVVCTLVEVIRTQIGEK